MTRILLIQLPIPQLNFGRQTGNVPLAAACLKQAVIDLPSIEVDILPESLATYLSDGALLDVILSHGADIIGFSVFGWNLKRSLDLARQIHDQYRPRIVFGGPEVTPDNRAVQADFVDFYVHGEGEAVFRRLLLEPGFWDQKQASLPADDIFAVSPSPYLNGFLDPEIEDMVLLETQRGCPYHCGYCYYPKSRERMAVKDEALVTEAVAWAHERGLSELYLLDPSLNVRPGLSGLLNKIKDINADHRVGLLSEIRAEAVDPDLADLAAACGFTWFEIGLQTVNPKALDIMRRKTSMSLFLQGVGRLKERGIIPGVDLIAGLPGDHLAFFCQSADFVREHDLHHDAQVFPLSILPGTDFRRNSDDLGLQYNPHPPYTIRQSPRFPEEHILLAFDYAENAWESSLHPLPDLDIAWRHSARGSGGPAPDTWLTFGGGRYLNKLVLEHPRPMEELEKIARRLTHPYQIFAGPGLSDFTFLKKALKTVTRVNPYTPLELILLEPEPGAGLEGLMEAIAIDRPQFLDVEWRYMFPRPGNRAVLFTFVSSGRIIQFDPDMQRHVFWWREPRLPDRDEIAAFDDLDGMLIDVDLPDAQIHDWQNQMAPEADQDLVVSFARVTWQNRWRTLTKAKDYYGRLFPVV